MSHFAKVDKKTKLVVDVVNATQAHIFTLEDSEDWVQTSYNNSFRNKFAVVGDTYDKDLDAFIYPKPFDSWILDPVTLQWVAPVEKPDEQDGTNLTSWDEETQTWIPHYSAKDVAEGKAPKWYLDKCGVPSVDAQNGE